MALYMKFVKSITQMKEIAHDMYDTLNSFYDNINTISKRFTATMRDHSEANTHTSSLYLFLRERTRSLEM